MVQLSFPPNSIALVTGATGFTGQVLVRALVQRGVRVRAIARGSSSLDSLSDLPVDWIRGEVFDPQIAQMASQGVHYVFHVAAAYREAKIDDSVYYRVHVESTQNLVRALAGSSTLRRFVHVSTVGVHGHIEDPPADEEYRFAPGDAYQNTKAEAELWLRSEAASSGIPWTVIRPAAIIGPKDRRLLKIFKLATKPFFPILGGGRCLYHLIHVDDLVAAMLHSAIHPAAVGEVFIVGDREAVALPEMVRMISDELRTHPRIVRIPVAPFFALAALCEAVCRPLKIEPPLYRRRVAFFTKDRSFNTSKLRDLLEFTPQHTNESAIRGTAQWYRKAGWL